MRAGLRLARPVHDLRDDSGIESSRQEPRVRSRRPFDVVADEIPGAGLLLALGGVFGCTGLVFSAAGRFRPESMPPDVSPAIAGVLKWGPTTLIGLGATLGALACLLVSFRWIHDSP